MKNILNNLPFLLVGLISVSLAWSIASYFIQPSRAQLGRAPVPPIQQPQDSPAAHSNASSEGIDIPPPPPVGVGEENTSPQADVNSGEKSGPNFSMFLEPYNYDPSGRRDPFRPILSMLDPNEGSVIVPRTPLESYDLSQFKLIGIIWNVKNPKAMFVDPNNDVHILEKDQRIGRNQGYIAVIREGEVVVVEAKEQRGEPVFSAKVLTIEN